jgi:hypothetical protein
MRARAERERGGDEERREEIQKSRKALDLNVFVASGWKDS